MKIPLNKHAVVGREREYVEEAIRGSLSGNGEFTKKCCRLMEERFGAPKIQLTTSCTHALEMASTLINIKPGDEVIVPSYTFPSTANAFMLRGAVPVFVDVREDTLNLDGDLIEARITPKTKAICPVHYAGVGCDMDAINKTAKDHGLYVIEDAAQAVNSIYKGRYLGTIGSLGCFSFHETKNITCGEGGAISVNDRSLIERAEIIAEKGTDRSRFNRGQVDKYTWVDVGSSYIPSELNAAYLYGQLERMDEIKERRGRIFARYLEGLEGLSDENKVRLPIIPPECSSNYHMFHIFLPDEKTRDGLMRHLNEQGIGAVFHYMPLHTSTMGARLGYGKGEFPVTEEYSGRILRLPFYFGITPVEQDTVLAEIRGYLE
jgi:dTDP-4-amino-4,6-dideoxygalactose transaminase